MLAAWTSTQDKWPTSTSALQSATLRLRTAWRKLPHAPPGVTLHVEPSQPLGCATALGMELAVGDHAVGRVILVGDLELERRILGLIDQAAHLEDQQRVAVLEDGHLRVGRLALVLVGEAAAQAPDLGGQRRALDRPAGHVDLVDALVADVAVAEVPEPVPVVMDQVAVVGLLGGGAEPEIEVQVGPAAAPVPLRPMLQRGLQQ